MQQLPAKSPVRICMVLDRPIGATETFLQAQLDYLPANVTLVQGFLARIAGRPVMSFSLPQRALRKAVRLATGQPYQAEATRSYRKAFELCGAQLVLAQYGPNGVHVLEACREAGLPLVVHFHGHDASSRTVLEQQRAGYQRLFAAAQAIVVVSQDMQQRLIALGASPEKLHLNTYGVDLQAFQGASPAEAPPKFLAVGRFTEKKAPHLTLLAFAQLHQRCPAATLTMIGDGPLLAACRQLVTALRLGQSISLLGAQPASTIQAEMRSARCFVQHSVIAPSGDAEGAPVAVLEAGATGLPVVATRHAGIPDVVLDGETGLLVEEYDITGMAATMERLAGDASFAGQLGTAARERVAEHFSREKSISGLWQILQASLARANSGSAGVTQ